MLRLAIVTRGDHPSRILSSDLISEGYPPHRVACNVMLLDSAQSSKPDQDGNWLSEAQRT